DGLPAPPPVPGNAVPRVGAARGRATPGSRPTAARAQPLAVRSRWGRARAPSPAGAELAEGLGGAVASEVATPSESALPLGPQEQAPPVVPPVESPLASTDLAAGPALRIPRGATPQELADRLGASASEIVKLLFQAGEMVSVNHSLSDEAIELVGTELGRLRESVGPREDPTSAREDGVVAE